jgi:rubrerythrin
MAIQRNPSLPEKCANCGRRIGNLETPFVWQASIVCVECYERLRREEQLKPPPITPPTAEATAELRPAPTYVCPICDSPVMPVRKANGSIVVALVILAFGILCFSGGAKGDGGVDPWLGLIFCFGGLAYAVKSSGHSWVCPICKAKRSEIG